MQWKKLSEERPHNKRMLLITDGKNICSYNVYKEGQDEYHPLAALEGSVEFGNEEWGGTTHWIYLNEIPLPNQPERSKREDSQKCAEPKTYAEMLISRSIPILTGKRMEKIHWHKCINNSDHKCEMRCSEHCGNTMRDK